MSKKAEVSKVLPTKEMNNYKQLLKYYDDKQFSKGLKIADQILKKFPQHTETLAIKGLFHHSLGKKEEGYQIVRNSIKMDISNQTAWHVNGIIYKNDKNYNEASKCFVNALRKDPENQIILRDLSLIQIQIREFEAFYKNRNKILQLKSNQVSNWIFCALGAHLIKRYNIAITLIDSYLLTIVNDTYTNYEMSELILFKIHVYSESKDYVKGLEELDKNESKIVDRSYFKEMKALFNLQLNNYSAAEALYLSLIHINCDNFFYFQQLVAAYLKKPTVNFDELTEEEQSLLRLLFEKIQKSYPSSSAAKFLPLKFLTGEAFERALDVYCQSGLKKGIPNLFNSINFIYQNSEKTLILQNLFLGYLKMLEAENKLTLSSSETETPIVKLWTLAFLAQHYNKINNFEEAFDYINQAIEHTPTAIDLYLIKGRIYKKAGNKFEAAKLFDYGRKLDLADRYLNTKCTHYMLRADQLEKAESVVKLFTKETGPTTNNLSDMQAMWYEQEKGESHLRNREYGRALKQFLSIEEHFLDFVEDQYDFHSYSTRKFTLRAYLDLLKFIDSIYSSPRYIRAAIGIIKCYLDLYDQIIINSKKSTNQTNNETDTSSVTTNTKGANKNKPPKKKKNKNNNNNNNNNNNQPKASANKKGQKQAIKGPVIEPNYSELTEVADKLEAATKYVKILLTHAPKNLATQKLAFELYIRKKKYILALFALKSFYSIAPNDPEFHLLNIRFAIEIKNENLDERITTLINAELEINPFIARGDLDQWNLNYFSKHNSFSHRLAFIKVNALLNKLDSIQAFDLLSKFEDNDSNATIQNFNDALTFLIQEKLPQPEIGVLKKKYQSKFKYAIDFTSEGFPVTFSEIANSNNLIEENII
eukprot:TRINITY_DN911_c0_g1_i1.p1 TRINITY_DN911_c0_g1~~TRINITY_DN911_c0_g1_i1.p1  ORF type:complete len:874 (-),score=311.60 TRINITY_DN911_c0_g1_i1:80-2701(-)